MSDLFLFLEQHGCSWEVPVCEDLTVLSCISSPACVSSVMVVVEVCGFVCKGKWVRGEVMKVGL